MQNFWSISLAVREPQLIILLNVIYDSEVSWIQKFKRPDKQIERDLIRLANEIGHCTLISKLLSVDKSDVEKWRIEFMDMNTRLVKDIFKNKKQQPMCIVQKALKYAIERWNEEEG